MTRRGHRRSWGRVTVAAGMAVAVLAAARYPVAGVFRVGDLLDPVDGLYRTARTADEFPSPPGLLTGAEAPVDVAWDERGVPHVYAESDLDAARAVGYVVARDRLFQMDFLRRFTTGRLSEVFGAGALSTDRQMRRSGIERAVRANIESAREEGRPTYALFAAFAEGVNSYVQTLEEPDLPFEFRLFDYRPEPFTPLDPGHIGWNLIYDLSYRGAPRLDPPLIDSLLGPGVADLLFPEEHPLARPIVPPEEAHWIRAAPRVGAGSAAGNPSVADRADPGRGSLFAERVRGFFDGIGSNNWAVGPSRSASGAPILAGDMHLALWLPSIWYELHVVTPTMDSYGVTVPGVPLPIEAFNRAVGWTFTNTGADQIDHLRLELDPTRTRYRYDGAWRELDFVVDTIRVRGAPDVVDSIAWTHRGPVVRRRGVDTAIEWTGAKSVRSFDALLAMNRATRYEEFEAALRQWDAPMQNILYADTAGTIAVRSTGHLPVRADGGGAGYRDGTTSETEWTGRVPFDDLPHSVDPARGYLTSTNQRPTDASYPWYVGRDWQATTRSIRIDDLLSGRETHTPEQLASYQADIMVVQRDWFVPLLERARSLSPEAERIRDLLTSWSGEAGADRPEPLVLDVLIGVLTNTVWDEAAFDRIRIPSEGTLYRTLTEPSLVNWLDLEETEAVEEAGEILEIVLELTADSLYSAYGSDLSDWTWGRHHTLVLRHVTGTPALRSLWRGPTAFPGFAGTLSPAMGRTVTFGASWRVVVDFSFDRPRGRGIYAGGPSGNPFSRRYDPYVDDFVHFRYRSLPTPESPDELDVRLRLVPWATSDQPTPDRAP